MTSNGQLDPSTLVQAANGAPGQVLEKNTAAAWGAMVAAAAADGVHLRPQDDDGVSSCYRTFANQEHAKDLQLHHGGPTAATPGFSNHGWGTAIDIYMGPGVKAWLDANAARFGFSWVEGKASGESWHWVFVGGGSAVAGYSATVFAEQNWLNIARGEKLNADGMLGPLTVAAIERYQTFLRAYGYAGAIDGAWGPATQAAHANYYNQYQAAHAAPPAPAAGNPFGISDVRGLQKIAKLYGGNTAPDNSWGAQSAAGFSAFLRHNYGYSGNDALGPQMWAAIARWLRARYGYAGNDVPGPDMRSHLQSASNANLAAL